MTRDRLLLDVKDGVAAVTLNRPEARNALDTELLDQLGDCLQNLASAEEVRACVLTGAGPAFCAGADLKQRRSMTAQQVIAHTEAIFHIANLLEQLRVPVIAAVNGPAYAGGLELAVACDVRIASDRASFALPEVGLGIFPGAGGPIRLPRLVGLGWAKLMVFSGESITATEALRIGLVEKVSPAQMLIEDAMELAARIASNSPAGVRAAKILLNAAWDMPFSSASALSNALRHPLSGTKEAREGLDRFGDRRGR